MSYRMVLKDIKPNYMKLLNYMKLSDQVASQKGLKHHWETGDTWVEEDLCRLVLSWVTLILLSPGGLDI